MAGPRIRNDDGTAAVDPTGPKRAGAKSAAKDARDQDADALRYFQQALGRALPPHEKRVAQFKKRHDAYQGILDLSQSAPIRPRGVVLPRYAHQAAEVLISNLVDDHPKGIVQPQSSNDVESAKAMTQILNYYRRQDSQDAKTARHVRQTVIMGMGPAKVYWLNETLKRPKRVFREEIDGSMTEGVDEIDQVTDRPSFEPIPVYDFMYDPSASRTDELGYALIRHWTTLQSLKFSGRYKNLDKVGATRADYAGEQRSTGRDHAGRIEVIEYWTRSRLITVANRSIVIQDIPNPYHHCQIPVIIANTTPDLYTCDGVSVMDLLIPLQATAWDILNQLLRNVDLANLLMVKVNRTARFDKEQLTNADVGAIFDVDNTNDVEFFNAGGNILEPGMDALAMIKTTMQETTGTGVYLAGGASETVDQKTATGINVLSSMAQKLVLAMRMVIWSEYRRKSLQEIELIQQLCPKPIEYRVTGGSGFDTVMPWELQGDFDYDVGDVSESLNKQTARGEAQQLVSQFVAGAAAMMPTGIQPNWPKVFGDLLEAYDKVDEQNYFQGLPPGEIRGNIADLLPSNANSTPLQHAA